MRKSNTEFSVKQRDYLTKKFDQGISGGRHWKPKEVVVRYGKNLRENNEFYFSANEVLNENQIRSFFGRVKRDRQVGAAKQMPNDKASAKKQVVKDFDEENDDEEIDSGLQESEDDFQDIESSVEEIKMLKNIYTNG